ncbi:hypothetical protein GCM10023143_09740 [Compostibacter hankyongensis]|uniref:beta-N-acetylhexosaminidase n=2 Tax=Compostibacter hankyongensis TaxID=1007089 RepID=A0ABP8FJ20_9BACT
MLLVPLAQLSCTSNSTSGGGTDTDSSLAPVSIIPAPVKVEKQAGHFTINPSTMLVMSGTGLEKSIRFFNAYLQKYYGFQLQVKDLSKNGEDIPASNVVVLNYEKIEYKIPGAYNMEVTGDKVNINGDNEEGVFYGMQTLIQLLPPDRSQSLKIPAVKITDHPRFAYRGMMLDCGRHFFDTAFVKQFIDYLALQKMNTFHWHLTEDQGWRIEIKKYPRLTEVGAWRNGTIIGHHPGDGNDKTRSGGFYTQEQIKDIVRYAADRYITIIPEIEMPGHSSAAIAAYPQLSCFPNESTKIGKTPWNGPRTGKQVQQTWGVFQDVYAPTEYTFTFLENVLDEVIQLFPSKYIHIGGDECPKDNWKRSAFCQKLIREKGLKNEEGLQSYFVQRIEKYLNSKGREIIGWDEILEGGLAPNATVMSWRGEKGGIEAAKQHHDVVMSPTTYCYLDYYQSDNHDSLSIGGNLPLEKVYSYEPFPKELTADEAQYIKGVQANLWTEYIAWPSKVEYMLFPRAAALAEIAWSPKEKKNFNDFTDRLKTQYARYRLWGTSYFDIFKTDSTGTPK